MKHAPSRLQYCSAKPCNSRNWWMRQLILLCTRNCNKTKRSLERTKILKELDLYLLFLQLKTLVLMHPRQLLYHFNQLEGGGGEGLHRTLWCMCANVGKIEEREIQFGKNGEVQASRTQLLESTIWWSIKEQMRNETTLHDATPFPFNESLLC